jgi:hypothetical protein
MKALERALKIYSKKSEYIKLREYCFDNVIDVEDVARAWDKEFY